MLLAHYARPLARALHRRHRMPRLENLLQHMAEGLGTARSFRGMAKVLFFSVGPVLASALAYGLALHGLRIPGGLFAGAVVLGAIALGQSCRASRRAWASTTSSPAGRRAPGPPPEEAAAFSTLTHLGTVISQVAVGAWCVHRASCGSATCARAAGWPTPPRTTWPTKPWNPRRRERAKRAGRKNKKGPDLWSGPFVYFMPRRGLEPPCPCRR